MIFALVMLGIGLLFCWLAALGWKHRNEEKISLIEAGILKAAGAEPLPLTKFDRWFQKFQLVMMTIFGPLLVFIGGSGLLIEMGLL